MGKLQNLWGNFKHTNIWIIGVPEGEGEEQEIEHLFEKIVKERLLAKMEASVDTLCLFAQPKEGQQQFKNKKTTRTDRKLNCMEVWQPRS